MCWINTYKKVNEIDFIGAICTSNGDPWLVEDDSLHPFAHCGDNMDDLYVYEFCSDSEERDDLLRKLDLTNDFAGKIYKAGYVIFVFTGYKPLN